MFCTKKRLLLQRCFQKSYIYIVQRSAGDYTVFFRVYSVATNTTDLIPRWTSTYPSELGPPLNDLSSSANNTAHHNRVSIFLHGVSFVNFFFFLIIFKLIFFSHFLLFGTPVEDGLRRPKVRFGRFSRNFFLYFSSEPSFSSAFLGGPHPRYSPVTYQYITVDNDRGEPSTVSRVVQYTFPARLFRFRVDFRFLRIL